MDPAVLSPKPDHLGAIFSCKPDYLGAMRAPHRTVSDDPSGSASCLPGRGGECPGGGADARDIRECDD
eukprot:COSAG06_NODE_30862_length_531_cov_0.770833_1_plen_67_part_10